MNLSRCCQESVEGKSSSMDQDSVENLSVRQKVSRWIEKLSSSYRKKFQKARWIKIVITSVEKSIKRGSIDENLLRICREAVELDKKRVFQKEEKYKEMNANKQTTQT